MWVTVWQVTRWKRVAGQGQAFGERQAEQTQPVPGGSPFARRPANENDPGTSMMMAGCIASRPIWPTTLLYRLSSVWVFVWFMVIRP
jgi:hypothetical protein